MKQFFTRLFYLILAILGIFVPVFGYLLGEHLNMVGAGWFAIILTDFIALFMIYIPVTRHFFPDSK